MKSATVGQPAAWLKAPRGALRDVRVYRPAPSPSSGDAAVAPAILDSSDLRDDQAPPAERAPAEQPKRGFWKKIFGIGK
jgi:hypothetical protein